jgi:hypothetical protein
MEKPAGNLYLPMKIEFSITLRLVYYCSKLIKFEINDNNTESLYDSGYKTDFPIFLNWVKMNNPKMHVP